MIDLCHQSGVGVILDWVPAHFPKDGHGLIDFDGGCCYEYSDPERREHPDWGTRVFDYGRNETRSFLMSSAMFWLSVYHADGLRVDAVASMLYLDYGKRGGGPRNIYGGRENIEALQFLRKTNEQIFAAYPHTLMIAEESTAWPMVTKPAYMGGLGFNFKWNMGWMNDTLDYMKCDPIFRQYNHSKMTFSMMYAFSENYILPLSHDEVVHGKCSIIERMPGYYVDKFAGARAYLAYMMAHPGKKMTFMGIEFAQFIEWNFNQSLDWHLLDYEMHQKFKHYVKTLNNFYLQNPCLWELEDSWEGFSWITPGDYQGNTLSFSRSDSAGGSAICVFNFSPINREGYRLPLPGPGSYQEALNSNEGCFGGFGHINGKLTAENVPCGEKQWSAQLTLPPFGAIFLRKA
jgi:1,4-alpha-glucan branching enzyme